MPSCRRPEPTNPSPVLVGLAYQVYGMRRLPQSEVQKRALRLAREHWPRLWRYYRSRSHPLGPIARAAVNQALLPNHLDAREAHLANTKRAQFRQILLPELDTKPPVGALPLKHGTAAIAIESEAFYVEHPKLRPKIGGMPQSLKLPRVPSPRYPLRFQTRLRLVRPFYAAPRRRPSVWRGGGANANRPPYALKPRKYCLSASQAEDAYREYLATVPTTLAFADYERELAATQSKLGTGCWRFLSPSTKTKHDQHLTCIKAAAARPYI